MWRYLWGLLSRLFSNSVAKKFAVRQGTYMANLSNKLTEVTAHAESHMSGTSEWDTYHQLTRGLLARKVINP